VVNQASTQNLQIGSSNAERQLEKCPAGVDALYQFDQLPDAAHVRITVVMSLYGCSRATVWRWLKKSILPEPVKRGGITAWNVGMLRVALRNNKGD
jgi:hypothetical protein